MKEELLKVLVKSIDLKVMANGIVDEVLEEALKEVVADTTNQIDDMVMATLWPVFEREVKKLIEKKLDLEKLLKLNEEK